MPLTFNKLHISHTKAYIKVLLTVHAMHTTAIATKAATTPLATPNRTPIMQG